MKVEYKNNIYTVNGKSYIGMNAVYEAFDDYKVIAACDKAREAYYAKWDLSKLEVM